MFKSNNKIKTFIISMLAALAIALGILAFTSMPNSNKQLASAATPVGAVTLTLEPTQPSYSTLTTSTVSLQVKIRKTSGTAKIGAVQGNITFDGSVFSITDDDFVPHPKWTDDSSISAESGTVGFYAQAASANGDLADSEFVAITLNFTVNRSAVQEKSYTFTFVNDKWAGVTNISDGDDFTINPVNGTAVFASPSSNAKLASATVNGVAGTIDNTAHTVTVSGIPYVTGSTQTLTISATTEDSSATPTYPNKSVTWNKLSGEINGAIRVTPPSGASDAVDYKLIVTRANPKTTSNGSLTVTNGTPASISLTNGVASQSTITVPFKYRDSFKINFTPSDGSAFGSATLNASTSVSNNTTMRLNANAASATNNQLKVRVNSQSAKDNIDTTQYTEYDFLVTVQPANTGSDGTASISVGSTANSFTLSNGSASPSSLSVAYKDRNSVTVSATATSEEATVGKIEVIPYGGTATTLTNNAIPADTLKAGANTVKVYIQSETQKASGGDGTAYSITINVANPATIANGSVELSNAAPSSISLSGGAASPATVEVSYSMRNSISVTAVAADDQGAVGDIKITPNGESEVSINNGSTISGLKEGNNTLKVYIKSEADVANDGSGTAYTITIKVGTQDTATDLKNVKLIHNSYGEIAFTWSDSKGRWEANNDITNDKSLDNWKIHAEIDTSKAPNATFDDGTTVYEAAISLVYGDNLKSIVVKPSSESTDPVSYYVYAQSAEDLGGNTKLATATLIEASGARTNYSNGPISKSFASSQASGLKFSATSADPAATVAIDVREKLTTTPKNPIPGDAAGSCEIDLSIGVGISYVYVVITSEDGASQAHHVATISVMGDGTEAGLENINNKDKGNIGPFYLYDLFGMDFDLEVGYFDGRFTYSFNVYPDTMKGVLEFKPKDPEAIVEVFAVMVPDEDPTPLSISKSGSDGRWQVSVDMYNDDIPIKAIQVKVTPASGGTPEVKTIDIKTNSDRTIKFTTDADNSTHEMGFFADKVYKTPAVIKVGKDVDTITIKVDSGNFKLDIEAINGEVVEKSDDGKYTFKLDEGANSLVLRMTNGNKVDVAVFNVEREAEAETKTKTNVGMLVGIIVLAVLLVAAVVVMAVYIGKYVSMNKKNNESGYRD